MGVVAIHCAHGHPQQHGESCGSQAGTTNGELGSLRRPRRRAAHFVYVDNAGFFGKDPAMLDGLRRRAMKALERRGLATHHKEAACLYTEVFGMPIDSTKNAVRACTVLVQPWRGRTPKGTYRQADPVSLGALHVRRYATPRFAQRQVSVPRTRLAVRELQERGEVQRRRGAPRHEGLVASVLRSVGLRLDEQGRRQGLRGVRRAVALQCGRRESERLC